MEMEFTLFKMGTSTMVNGSETIKKVKEITITNLKMKIILDSGKTISNMVKENICTQMVMFMMANSTTD